MFVDAAEQFGLLFGKGPPLIAMDVPPSEEMTWDEKKEQPKGPGSHNTRTWG